MKTSETVRTLTFSEVAVALEVPYTLVQAWHRHKKLKAKPFPRGKYKTYRVTQDEVERIRERRRLNLPL